jgi:hypothetical protein
MNDRYGFARARSRGDELSATTPRSDFCETSAAAGGSTHIGRWEFGRVWTTAMHLNTLKKINMKLAVRYGGKYTRAIIGLKALGNDGR